MLLVLQLQFLLWTSFLNIRYTNASEPYGTHLPIVRKLWDSIIQFRCSFKTILINATNWFPSRRMPLFFRSSSPFPTRLFHAGNDKVLPSSPAETSTHHCFAFFVIRAYPVGNSGSGYTCAQPQGWKSYIHPGCAHAQLILWFRLMFGACTFLSALHLVSKKMKPPQRLILLALQGFLPTLFIL